MDESSGEAKRVREKLGVSQTLFARLLCVSVDTVQAWEEGNPPCPMAQRLLALIDRDPLYWRRLVIMPAKARPA